jgi:hypothetical protein
VLPGEIKKEAKEAYKLFVVDPYHPSLHFKRVHSRRPIFSLRVTKDYRAVGILQNEEMIWFWIGSHSEYDKLLKQLRNV